MQALFHLKTQMSGRFYMSKQIIQVASNTIHPDINFNGFGEEEFYQTVELLPWTHEQSGNQVKTQVAPITQQIIDLTRHM